MYLTLKNTTMACDAPLSIRYKNPRQVNGELQYYFPGDCGKCLPCLQKRKRQWSYRLTEEKRVSFSSYFITLTYQDKYLPLSEGITSSVNKNDHFDFIKNLKELEKQKNLALRSHISQEEHERKERGILENGKLKYYGISEYGDQGGRVHWHYLIFNLRDSNNIALAWGKGKVDVDPDVNVNNIDYVLKYMVKFKTNAEYENKEREISFMSKGIGSSVVDDEFRRYISKPYNNKVVTDRGNKISLPRYYNKKYLSEEERINKSNYIAKEIQEAKAEKEHTILSLGLPLGNLERSAKESRLHQLKSRQKRNYE